MEYTCSTKFGVDSSSRFPVRARTDRQTYKYVRLRGRPYIHICRYYAWPVRTPASPTPWRGRRGGASGVAKFLQMGNSLPWTLMNRRAEFDAAGFSLGGEIRNGASKKHTNSNRYPHGAYRREWITNRQTDRRD